MLTILIKLPRTEKFRIGTEIKTSMYEMLKYILLSSKVEKKKKIRIIDRYAQIKKDYKNEIESKNKVTELIKEDKKKKLIYR